MVRQFFRILTMNRKVVASSLITVVIFYLQLLCVSYAQENAAISDSVYSGILKEERSLKILLPETYKPGSTDTYEVIYVTDGEWGTDLFSYIYRFAQGEHYVPPVIIVGIPNTYMNKANQRDRDFLPVHAAEPAISGGASNFLSFIKGELVPYIDHKYPTNGTNSIYGHSYGGLFVLYALLTEPQVFGSYYATDPPFRWNDDYLIKLADQKLGNIHSDKVLWIAGIESTFKDQGIGRLDSLLQVKAPTHLHWKMVTYPNEKHNSVRLKAMYDGIKFSYSGYSDGPLSFHPMNGILLKDKPVSIWVESYPEVRYTLDGSEPSRTSQKVGPELTIAGPAQLVLKSFSASGKYDKTARGNFEVGEALAPTSKPEMVHSGGLKYSLYEGSWEKLPDFNDLTSAKTGVADSAFDIHSLQRKTDFACLFQGYFEIVRDGYYIFALVSNDGSKLFLGNKLVIDNDGVRSTESAESFVLPLEKGFYPVRIEYFQKDDGSVLQLYYVEPDTRIATRFPFRYQYYQN
jgi:predicted alpha/beta superfamily hydrolase